MRKCNEHRNEKHYFIFRMIPSGKKTNWMTVHCRIKSKMSQVSHFSWETQSTMIEWCDLKNDLKWIFMNFSLSFLPQINRLTTHAVFSRSGLCLKLLQLKGSMREKRFINKQFKEIVPILQIDLNLFILENSSKFSWKMMNRTQIFHSKQKI